MDKDCAVGPKVTLNERLGGCRLKGCVRPAMTKSLPHQTNGKVYFGHF